MMTPSVATPAWVVQAHRGALIKIGGVIQTAFWDYRERLLPVMADFPQKQHVSNFNVSVRLMIAESFAVEHQAGQVGFSNEDDLFLLSLESELRIRFNAAHDNGRPRRNKTKQSREFFDGQGDLYDHRTGSFRATLAATYIMDPSWETAPEVWIWKPGGSDEHGWRFKPEDVEMEKVLALHAKTS